MIELNNASRVETPGMFCSDSVTEASSSVDPVLHPCISGDLTFNSRSLPVPPFQRVLPLLSSPRHFLLPGWADRLAGWLADEFALTINIKRTTNAWHVCRDGGPPEAAKCQPVAPLLAGSHSGHSHYVGALPCRMQMAAGTLHISLPAEPS